MQEQKNNYTKYNNNYNNNNYNNYNSNKKNNIFILTNDNYYFIIEKKFIKDTLFFKNLFEVDKTAGHLKNPIFLQKIKSIHFKYIVQYLKKIYYEKNNKKFNIPEIFNVVDIFHYYQENDKEFIKEICYFYKDISKLEEFIKTIEYIGVPNLYKKIKTYYNFIKLFSNYEEDNNKLIKS
jgi:hypothetical protein